MHSILRHGLTAAAAIGVTSAVASADLVISVSDANEPLWHVDVDTGTYTPLLEGFGAQAIANDDASETLYFMTNTVTLYSWNYGNPSASPTLIGNTTSDQATSPFVSITGLGWDGVDGRLVGSRTLDSSGLVEGLYELSTADATVKSIAPFPGSTFDFGAFDIDAATGKAYGFSDGLTSGSSQGLYEIDLATGVPTLLAAPPPGSIPTGATRPDIDGLAVGDGVVYLVQDRAVQTGGSIFTYDLASGTYGTPLQVPWFFNETFSGATWISDASSNALLVPEPASATLLLVIGALGLRRRR
ncbi:MAG: hypothetical protein AAGI46_05510 [Planctomycetota bacterium]